MSEDMPRIVWTRAARKHRVGKASALHVMGTATPVVVAPDVSKGQTDARVEWTGEDERGRELHVVALDLPGVVVVIHVFPTALNER